MASSIPATLAALVTLWKTARPDVATVVGLTLSGDGGTPTNNIYSRVYVGHDPEGGDDVTWNREWAGIGTLRIDESFDIPCFLECVSGDDDLLALRNAAFDLLDDLSTALAADITLGGLVQQGAAILGNGRLIPGQQEKGASTAIPFVVHCETRINQS
jgi:hypothetical protein